MICDICQGKPDPRPRDYRERCEAAAKKEKTHRQVECEKCRLYLIWVPIDEDAK